MEPGGGGPLRLVFRGGNGRQVEGDGRPRRPPLAGGGDRRATEGGGGGGKLRGVVVAEGLRWRAVEIVEQRREGRAWRGEFVVRRRDGTLFPVEGTDTPVFGENDGLIGVIGVLRDVTERKEAEEALRRSEAELFSVLESITDAFFAL